MRIAPPQLVALGRLPLAAAPLAGDVEGVDAARAVVGVAEGAVPRLEPAPEAAARVLAVAAGVGVAGRGTRHPRALLGPAEPDRLVGAETAGLPGSRADVRAGPGLTAPDARVDVLSVSSAHGGDSISESPHHEASDVPYWYWMYESVGRSWRSSRGVSRASPFFVSLW